MENFLQHSSGPPLITGNAFRLINALAVFQTLVNDMPNVFFFFLASSQVFQSEFHVPSVKFLEYIMESGQVKTDPEKIQAVSDLPTQNHPETSTGVLPPVRQRLQLGHWLTSSSSSVCLIF